MKYSLFFLLLAPLVSQAEIKYSCPVEGQHRTKDEAYEAMRPGLIYGESDSPMVFVDETNELKDTSGNLTPIGETFVDSSSGQLDIRGTFKIGYDYNAKECRRQIVLENEIGSGVWSGYTAIEICNPEIKGLIESLKAKDFKDVFVAIKIQADKLYDAYKTMNKALDADHTVCDSKDTATYDATKCRDERNKAYAFSKKSSSLKGLEITSENEKYVQYYKNKEGIILPRFKVTGREYFFRRETRSVYDPTSKAYEDRKNCTLRVRHATGYAGLSESYTWNFSYADPSTADTWTYNGTASTKSTSYKKDINDFNFLDKNEYFFLGN